jgi:multidrug efflux system outer membrane protein
MKSVLRLVSIAALTLPGCKLGPNFQPAETGAGDVWKEGRATPNASLPDAWWRLFGDPELNRLVDRALAANQDLAAARSRLDTSRALVGLDRARLFPTLNLTADAGISRLSQDAIGANLPPGISIDLERQRYRSTFNLAYDLDLWGRNKRLLEASSAEAAANAAVLDAHRLGIAAEVARQYFLLRGLDAQEAVLRDTLRSREQALGLQKSRADAGLTDGLASGRARTELELANHDVAAVERQRGAAEHALAVLCGVAPSSFGISQRGFAGKLPTIRPGLPAEVLARRPDVRASEQRLRAANARIGAAMAAFYPNISLSASGGFESIEAKRFLNWENRVLSLGANLAQPLLDGGANKANLAASRGRFNETLAGHRQALLIALREVEDALVDLRGLARSKRALEAALVSARDTRSLSQERFDKGLTNYLEVVDLDRNVLQIRLTLAQLEAQQRISLVALAKALGGGWGVK